MYQNEFHPQRWKKALTNQSKPWKFRGFAKPGFDVSGPTVNFSKNFWGAADCCSTAATEICLARSKASGSWAETSIAACMHTACAYGANGSCMVMCWKCTVKPAAWSATFQGRQRNGSEKAVAMREWSSPDACGSWKTAMWVGIQAHTRLPVENLTRPISSVLLISTSKTRWLQLILGKT